MRNPRMIRIPLEKNLQDLGRLFLVAISLVRRKRRRIQGQGVKGRCLGVFWVIPVKTLHRLFIGQGTRSVIVLLITLVKGLHGGHIVLLPLCLGPDRFRPPNRLESFFEFLAVRRGPQRKVLAHGDSPVSHGALFIGGQGLGECLLGPRVPEGMKQGDAGFKPLPRLGRAGNRKGHPAHFLRLGLSRVMTFLRRRWARKSAQRH